MATKPTLKDKEAVSTTPLYDPAMSLDPFAVHPALLEDIKQKNLAHRWINAKKFKDNYGYDSRQWTPYKPDVKITSSMEYFGYADPEGFIRRGDSLLAVQPMAIKERRSAQISQKTQHSAKAHRQASKAQLESALKSTGDSKAKVHEGYDD
jgi:hypothetical protein